MSTQSMLLLWVVVVTGFDFETVGRWSPQFQDREQCENWLRRLPVKLHPTVSTECRQLGSVVEDHLEE
jgi:hypothetical protein